MHAPASDRAIVDRLAQLRYAGGANRSHCLMEGKATRIPVEPAMGDEPRPPRQANWIGSGTAVAMALQRSGRSNALTDDAFLKLRKASALPIAYAQMLSAGQLGMLEHLARMQAELRPPPAVALPESIDSLFDMWATI